MALFSKKNNSKNERETADLSNIESLIDREKQEKQQRQIENEQFHAQYKADLKAKQEKEKLAKEREKQRNRTQELAEANQFAQLGNENMGRSDADSKSTRINELGYGNKITIETTNKDGVVESTPSTIKKTKGETIRPVSSGIVATVQKHTLTDFGSLFGLSKNIGKREYQQDSIGTSEEISYKDTFVGKNFMAVLCDGMGGLNGGERASELCVNGMLEAFKYKDERISPQEFYRDAIIDLDDQVWSLKDANGNQLGAGSTLISVIVKDGSLFYASVGDSRIYRIRNNVITTLNEEHNYYQDLLEQVRKGNITQAEADNDPHREALTSYMGIGGVDRMDIGEYRLEISDIIVLCSGGLYRALEDGEIQMHASSKTDDMQETASRLVNKAIARDFPNQDNISAIVLKYK